MKYLIIVIHILLTLLLVGCADKSVYVGEKKDGKRHGQGTFTWSDGRKYIGEYKDGKQHGQGTFTWSDGRKYKGEYKDGKKHGQGTMSWSDGYKYEGGYKNGKKHGRGTITDPTKGWKFVGNYSKGKKQGIGTLYYLNNGKIKYFGILRKSKKWNVVTFDKNNQHSGVLKGKKVQGHKYGKNFFYGNFKNNEPNGLGIFVWKNYKIFIGSLNEGNLVKGLYRFPDGATYEGGYKDGKRNGQGTFTLPDGSRYVGEFRNGNRNGYGIFYLTDGSILYDGNWKDNKQNGKGVKFWFNKDIDPNNKIKIVGTFKNDSIWNGNIFNSKGKELGSVRKGKYWKIISTTEEVLPSPEAPVPTSIVEPVTN